MALAKPKRSQLEAELTVLLKKGRLQRAAAVLRAILEQDPDDDRLFVKLAEVSLKLGDQEGVRAAFRGAAAAAERKGFYLRAMAALRQLARHQAPRDRPWAELSGLAMRLGLVGDALGFLDEGARAWEAAGDAPSVLQALRRARELAPDDVHRALRLGHALRLAGRGEEAMNLLTAEAARHRASGRQDAWLALTAERSGLVPTDRALACEVASAYLSRGEPLKALQRLQPLLRERAQHPDSLRLLVRVFEALGQPARRLAAVRDLARALTTLGRDAAARPHWEALLAAEPADPEARRALGLGPSEVPAAAARPAAPEEEIIDLAAAGVEVEDAAPAAPGGHADLDDDLAHLDFLVAHRFAEEARALLGALEAAHPGHPGLAALRARLDAGPERVRAHPPGRSAAAGRPWAAPQASAGPAAGEPVPLEALGGVELVAAEDAATHYDLGIAYREMGLVSEARSAFELAATSARGPRAVDALIGLALCQAAQGAPDQAARTLKRALAHPALTPVGAAAVFYELGMLREARGDAKGAAWAFRAAERSQPRYRDAAARAGRLHPGAAPGDEAPGLDPLPTGA